ncbi:MAG TPA: SH3 domain-containing protein [Clostridiales bacterium]|nr:SH3 domain-containing protein [Clostridiales bacterium]
MRRFLAFIISFLVALNFTLVKPAYAAVDYNIIKVKLSSMGTPTSIEVTVEGDYSIKENSSIALEQKKTYTIKLNNGSLVLTDGTNSWTLGTKFTFIRNYGSLKVKNASYGLVNYLGDMEVRIESNYITLVNHVHLELYLYGVVPYEMSNSWPMEALKAQAISARTFAVDKIKTRSSQYYHLVDTQSSQVYEGYNKAMANCIEAVNQTMGQVLMYESSFAQTFYSASNGGMTERAGNIFSQDFPYLVVKPDSYDIENPSNNKARWEVKYYKTPVNTELSNKIVANIKTSLGNKGYSTADSDIKVKSLKEFVINYNDSGRLDNGKLTVVVDAKRKSDGKTVTVEEAVSLTKNNTRSILSLYSLLFQVEDAGDHFLFKGGGYGHGVGMSQYGAQYMAKQGMNSDQILQFYYPGTVIGELDIQPPPNPDSTPAPTSTPEPTVSPSQTPAPTATPTPNTTPTPTPQPTATPTPKPTATPAPTASPAPSYGTVKVNTSLNVRKGPGTSYQVIGSLTNNTKVEILEKSGEWYKVKKGSLTGYVSAKYIVLDPPKQPDPPSDPGQPGTPPVDPALPPDKDKIGIVTASSLNIRSGPGTNNHKVGMVIKGQKVTVHEKVGDWYKITYNGIQGYVHSSYIKLQESNETPAAGKTGTVTASSLNVRSGPGTGYSKVGSLSKGTTVTILSSSNGWYKIQKGSLVGYVSGDYLDVKQSQQPEETEKPTTVTATVTASSLNVRSGPGTGYSKVGSLSKGTTVTILSSSNGWYKIQKGSLVGYVSGDYLKISQSQPSDRGGSTKTGVVTASSLNVRSGAGTSYKIIGGLKRDTKIEILGTSGSWYKIRYNSLTGYVHKDYVKLN